MNEERNKKHFIDEQKENRKILDIQKMFEEGLIKEEELTEEIKYKLMELYRKQIENLKIEIEVNKKELQACKEEIKNEYERLKNKKK